MSTNEKAYNNFQNESSVNFQEIEAAAQNDIPGLVQKWLPDGRQQGAEWVTLNPTRADNTVGSFKINLNTGKWADFANNAAGNGIASLYHYLSVHTEYRDSMIALGQELGIQPPKPSKKKPPPKVYKSPPNLKKYKDLPHSQTWKYQDEQGKDVLLVQKFSSATKKEFLQVSRVEGGWSWGGLKTNPLYRLLDISSLDNLPVVVCEGEKPADAAQQIFGEEVVTTTTAGGSMAPQKTDFSPMKNRDVYIWPDNDAPGKKYADRVAKLALEAGASSVHVLPIPENWADKWDAADVLDQGGSIDPSVADFLRWPEYIPAKTKKPKQKQQYDNDFTYTDDRGKLRLPQHSIAVEYLIQHHYLENYKFSIIDKKWYEYSEGFWQENDEGFWLNLKNTLNKLSFGVGYSYPFFNSVARLAQIELSIKQWETDKTLLPFSNGVLNLKDMSFRKHQKCNNLSWQLPYKYEKSATCKPVTDWLYETTGGNENKVNVLRAFLNATLLGKSNLQVYLELLGAGGTGKSTFLNLARSLIGVENTHSTDLRSISTNRFETASFFGKRLLLMTDESRWGGDMAIFRAVTGEDGIRFERKGKDADKSFIFEGIVMLASNEAIQSTDFTSALARRRVTIDFNHKPHKPDRKLLDKLKSNLSGVVNWCLGMSDDQVEKIIFDHQSAKNLDVVVNTNPLAAWILENLHHDQTQFTPIGVKKYVHITQGDTTTRELIDVNLKLYPNFVDYCETNGVKAIVTKERFKGLVLDICNNQLHIDVEWKRTEKGRVFIGLVIAGSNLTTIQEQLKNKNDGLDDGQMTAKMTASSYEIQQNDGHDGFDEIDSKEKHTNNTSDDINHAIYIDKNTTKPSWPSLPSKNNDISRHCSRHQAVIRPSSGRHDFDEITQHIENITETDKVQLNEFLVNIEKSKRAGVLGEFAGRYAKDSEGAWAWLVGLTRN